MPRFVSKLGEVNELREWAKQDKILDTDGDRVTFDSFSATNNRNPFVPLAGFRKSLKQFVDTKQCQFLEADNTVDRILGGYETCSF